MAPIKICGLKDPASLTAAIEGGADFVGFVFYPPSPRFIDLEVVAELAKYVPAHVKIVGLFVDPDDDLLRQAADHLPLSLIQLHGNETPARVAEIKVQFSLPVMKAVRVETAGDLEQVAAYEEVCDWLLFDAKANAKALSPAGERAIIYGGTGQCFDWTILKDTTFKKPWMLAGGLNIYNIKEALSVLSPDAVDVSSGVESEKGVKDPDKIKEFLDFVKNPKTY